MIWGKSKTKKLAWRKLKASRWFAWYPVHLEDGRWAWLEFVRYEYWQEDFDSGYSYYLIKEGYRS